MKQITKNKAPWLTGLMAGAVLCSCSNEAPFMPEPVTGVEGDYPVILNLNGLTAATRAYSEDGERYAALDRERTINSLYAVAFYDGDVADNDVIYSSGTLYKVFKVTLPGDGNYVPKDADTERPYFDMTSGGKFKLWFVANPGDELLAKIYDENDANGCGSGLTHGISTKEDLRNLSTANELGSRVGNLPASHDNFLLFSVEEKNVETAIESVNRITVTMERASARFDLLNQTEGVSVLGLEFTNPYTSTLLDEATSEADQANLTVAQSPVTVDFTSEYGAEGLTGSLALPGNYSARVYAYEHIADNGIYSVNAPEIKLTYKVEGEEDVKTATVSFNIPVKYAEDVTADATSFMGDDGNSYSGDEYIDGKVHAKGDYVVKKNNDDTYEVATTDKKYSILRNHLYRIRLIGVDDVNKPILLPLIEVLDWNEAEIIKGEEYVSDLTQADLNRRLYINRFKFNYVKAGFNPASGTVSFAADNQDGCFEANEYNTAWAGEYDANGNLTRVALYKDADDPHHTEYRLPTADELAYLSYENSGNINVFGEILNSDVESDNVIWTDNTGAESIYTRYEGTNQYSVWYSKLNGDYITYKVRGLDPNAKPGDKNYVDVSAITANDSFWNDPNYVITLDMLIEEDALLASSAHNLLTDSAVKRFKGLSLDGADFSRIAEYDPTVLTNKIRLMMVTAYDEVAAKK